MRGYYNILIERVGKLVKASGFTWAYAYMKEVLRLTTISLAGNPEFGTSFVKRDKYGLPTVVPGPIRIMFRSFIDDGLSGQVQRRVIIATLSLLAIFRVFPVEVKPSLLTIMRPFAGRVKTLPASDTVRALKSLGTGKALPKLYLGEFKPLVSQKAGPNGTFATWSAGIDALAFLSHPDKILPLLQWMKIQRAYWWIAYFVFLNLAFGWIYLILRMLGLCKTLQLGKLAVVYNQAGKARVVAATNWWYQSIFAGLHESIFRLLRTVIQDGTFDQAKCYNKLLLRSDFRENLSGYDLSAATDRLPIDLQSQILNELGIPGDLWQTLLSITWHYNALKATAILRKGEDGVSQEAVLEKGSSIDVRYEVGQPMGALSSWAMLALSHHVIARIAFIQNSRKPEFGNYAVLGDDIVINDDAVASTYLTLMDDLGLTISMGKSVISKDFTEFAKELKGFGLDITPIGAGIILSASRSAYYLPTLILKAIDKFVLSPDGVLGLLRSLPGGLFNRRVAQDIIRTSLLMTFASNAWYREISLLNVKTLKRYSNFFSADIAKFPDALYVTLVTFFEQDLEKQRDSSHVAMRNFITEAFALFATRGTAMRLLELLMKPFNPGFWIYLFDAFALPGKLDALDEEIHREVYAIPADEPFDRCRYLFSRDSRASVLDIDNLKDHEVKLVSKFYLEIYRSLQYKLYL